jgi:hypothetical protein
MWKMNTSIETKVQKFAPFVVIIIALAMPISLLIREIHRQHDPKRIKIVSDSHGHYRVVDKVTGYVSDDFDSCRQAHKAADYWRDPEHWHSRPILSLFSAERWKEDWNRGKKYQETMKWKDSCSY